MSISEPNGKSCLEHADATCDSFWQGLQENSGFPLCITLCVTERCTLKCPHCYVVPEAAGHSGELSLAEIESLLDELVDLEVLKLTITGGEPALRPDLAAIVGAAWKRRFLISLKTSGALLDSTGVERLWASGLATLMVSLYHVDPAKHDAFVGREGAWRATMNAVETFSRLGGLVVVGSVAMSWNLDVIELLTSLCQERGWSCIVDPKLLHANDGSDRAARYRLGAPDFREFLARDARWAVRGPARSHDDPVCLAGINNVYIRPNGEVWPCSVMPLALGSIRDSSLADIWSSSPVLKRLLALRWGDFPKCASCGINRFCQRCPGESLQEHGDLTKEATVDCALAEAHFRIWSETHPDEL